MRIARLRAPTKLVETEQRKGSEKNGEGGKTSMATARFTIYPRNFGATAIMDGHL